MFNELQQHKLFLVLTFVHNNKWYGKLLWLLTGIVLIYKSECLPARLISSIQVTPLCKIFGDYIN